MKKSTLTLIVFFFLSTMLYFGCVLIPGHGFSEWKNNRSAGNNLGFEVLSKGIPVNWNFKTQRVINNMSKYGDVVDFYMIVDSTDYIEGSKSLKYVVRNCNSTRENMSLYAYYPGFFKEYDADEGATYKVSFWVKNKGCDFEVFVNAIRVAGYAPPCDDHKIVSKDDIPEWKQFSVEQTICKRMERIRIEVNVKSKGVFQIDNFKIEKIK